MNALAIRQLSTIISDPQVSNFIRCLTLNSQHVTSFRVNKGRVFNHSGTRGLLNNVHPSPPSYFSASFQSQLQLSTVEQHHCLQWLNVNVPKLPFQDNILGRVNFTKR